MPSFIPKPEARAAALPRLTLMMYELDSPGDGIAAAQKAEKVRRFSQKFLDMAYEDLPDSSVAGIVIALRTLDCDDLLPQMLKSLDEGNRASAHYLGWARHSYNDALSGHFGGNAPTNGHEADEP